MPYKDKQKEREFRNRQNAKRRERYATDPEFRERRRALYIDRYAIDPIFRANESLRKQEYNTSHRERRREIDLASHHRRRAAGLAEMDQIVTELGGTPLV